MTPPTEFVRSRYRSPWIGAVLRHESRRHRSQRLGDLLTIVLLIDRHGAPMERRIVMKLDEHWTTPAQAIDVSHVNPDWWKLPEGELK
jgi:hypothetical protein